MFQLKNGSNRDCDGVTRRDVLRVGSLAAARSRLARSFSRPRAMAGSPGKEVSCILLWLRGISHIDSFDPRPEAPAEIRGEFGVIETKVPGIQVCEPLPRLAQLQDKFSILRSLNPQQRVCTAWPMLT